MFRIESFLKMIAFLNNFNAFLKMMIFCSTKKHKVALVYLSFFNKNSLSKYDKKN